MVSLLKMRKSGDNLVPVLRGQYIKGLRTGIKAFCGASFGKDDLMGVTQKVMIADLSTGPNADCGVIDQMFGRNQHLGLTKQQFGHRARHQHPMILRDHQRTDVAQGPSGEVDGGIYAGAGHFLAPDPSDALGTMIQRGDQIAL